MVEAKARQRDGPLERLKELKARIKSHQRVLELQARLVLMASAFGATLQDEDLAAVGWLITKFCEDQNKILEEEE
ncbi:MAG: hypothetical protein SV375_11395 [Thermodesulfobacteriota bacterium]|nr:hypothetical protein [Thermodesulfobacteriota bacterium]